MLKHIAEKMSTLNVGEKEISFTLKLHFTFVSSVKSYIGANPVILSLRADSTVGAEERKAEEISL